MRRETARSTRLTKGGGVFFVALLAVGVAAGCRAPQEGADESAPAPGATRSTADPGRLAEVIEADREFERAVAEGGLDAWVTAFDEKGAMILPSGPVPVGSEAVREAMAPAFGEPGFSLEWEPLGGEVAACGDLAYTYGDYESRSGGEVIARGRYVTVWKRGPDGRWRVLSDIGNRQLGEEP